VPKEVIDPCQVGAFRLPSSGLPAPENRRTDTQPASLLLRPAVALAMTFESFSNVGTKRTGVVTEQMDDPWPARDGRNRNAMFRISVGLRMHPDLLCRPLPEQSR